MVDAFVALFVEKGCVRGILLVGLCVWNPKKHFLTPYHHSRLGGALLGLC